MFFYVIMGFFAAVGLLSILWLIAGAFLPGAKVKTVTLFCPNGQEFALLRRYRWLRELGLVRCRLVLLESSLTPEIQAELTELFPGVSFYTLEQWQTKQEKE